jgi:hypothetical protein
VAATNVLLGNELQLGSDSSFRIVFGSIDGSFIDYINEGDLRLGYALNSPNGTNIILSGTDGAHFYGSFVGDLSQGTNVPYSATSGYATNSGNSAQLNGNTYTNILTNISVRVYRGELTTQYVGIAGTVITSQIPYDAQGFVSVTGRLVLTCVGDQVFWGYTYPGGIYGYLRTALPDQSPQVVITNGVARMIYLGDQAYLDSAGVHGELFGNGNRITNIANAATSGYATNAGNASYLNGMTYTNLLTNIEARARQGVAIASNAVCYSDIIRMYDLADIDTTNAYSTACYILFRVEN